MANEKRLVTEFRNELMSEFIRLCKGNDFGKLTLLKAGDVIERLYEKYSTIPTVDAAPVVHGRCEYCKDGKSFIGARMLLGNDGKWHDINNCPNCGAKMDGDGNG